VFDSFPTYIDVSTVTTSRGTITKLTHSFVVTIGDIVPNEKITIIAVVKVNSTLTRTEINSNLVTLAYNYSKSITSSVNYTSVYQALPPTGELPLNWRDTRLKPAALIPGILLLGLGAVLLLFGIWLKISNKRDSYWMIAIGSLLIIIGFVAGINASGVLASSQLANGHTTAPTSSGILAQIYPVEITETGLPRLPASAFSTPEAFVPVVTLPDYPIPTPEITVTPQPGEAEPDTSPVVRIVIPGISLDTEVKYVPYDGYSWLINGLRQEVAWMGNTSWPGLGGNTALAGHVTVAGLGDGPFRHLDELLAGEVVILYTEKNMYTYNVRERRVTDDGDMSVTLASDNPQITLITCTDWDQESKIYLNRLVVLADLIRTEPITRGSIP
jgi:LPXTG-site transpeptidase (sortase) family protein